MKTKTTYQIAFGFSTLCFLLTLYTVQTILFGCLSAYLLIKYFKEIFNHYREQGIISFLPQSIQNHLLNRSLFDILCDFWFMESMNIIKVCLKPILGYVEPQNAADVLEELSSKTKQKFMTKGLVNILPEDCQKVILSQQGYRRHFENNAQTEKLIPCTFTDYNTNANSAQEIFSPTKKNKKKSQKFQELSIMDHTATNSSNDQSNSKIKFCDIKTVKRRKQTKWDRLQFYQTIKHQIESEGVLKTVRGVFSMIRNVIELKNLPNNIQTIKSSYLIKATIFFWLSIMLQIKMSPRARKFIFRFLYITSGVLTITGALGTSGVLFYKYRALQQNKNQR